MGGGVAWVILYLERGRGIRTVRVRAILGWSLIIFVLLFKLTFLYITDLGPPYAGKSFLFLRPPGFGYWAMDWRTANPVLTPAYQAITGALASGRGLKLPFAVPLDAASFLLSLVIPVTGFLLLHHFGRRLKWWYLALASLCVLSLTYQTTTVRVFTAPESQIYHYWSDPIQEASQKTGVSPALLAAVMTQESGGQAGAISYDPLGNPVAYGLMQLIPDTASRFGLPRQRILDPAENILAGAEYISVLEHDFNGHVDLVLASYYAGEHAVQAALARANLKPVVWNDTQWPKIEPYLPGADPGQPTVEQYVQQVKQKLDSTPGYVSPPASAYLRD